MERTNRRIACVHIGSHKTGTSAIQKSLYFSKLEENNYLYPVSILSKGFSHNNLALSILYNRHKDLDHYLYYLEKEIKNNKNNIIISSEILEKLIFIKKDKILKFLILLKNYFSEIRIIYSIRNEPDLCDSVFKQRVCSKEYYYKEETKTFINEFFNEDFSYNKTIDSWIDTNLISSSYVYWYSDNFLENINNFKQACELEIEIPDPGIVNPSIEGKILELAYFYNKNIKDDNVVKILKSLQLNLCDKWKYKKTILSEQEYDLYKNSFTEKKWHPSCVLLNNKPNKKYAKEKFNSITKNEAIEYLIELYQDTNLLELFKIII